MSSEDSPLIGLLRSMQRLVKEMKLSLMIEIPGGDPLRPLYAARIAAAERTVKGVESLIWGGSSKLMQEGFREMMSVLETLSTKVLPKTRELIYEERAHVLGLAKRLEGIDEVLAPPEEVSTNSRSEKKPLAN